MEEYERLNPPNPGRLYSVEGTVDESSLACLWDLEGVIGFVLMPDNHFYVTYETALITPAELDEEIRASGLAAVPSD